MVRQWVSLPIQIGDVVRKQTVGDNYTEKEDEVDSTNKRLHDDDDNQVHNTEW